MLFAVLIAAATAAPNPSAWTAQKPAVTAAARRAYPNARINSVLVSRSYALVAGKGIHAVFRKSESTWKLVCDLQRTTMTTDVLERSCGVPPAVAAHLAADEPVNLMANQGNFSAAYSLQQTLMSSPPAPVSEAESIRLQQLRVLNQQLQTGQITRAQAIQQWNSFQYSWALP